MDTVFIDIAARALAGNNAEQSEGNGNNYQDVPEWIEFFFAGEHWTYLICILALLSMAISVSIALTFLKTHRSMGKALFYMLLGEATGTAIILVFAASSLIRGHNDMPDAYANLLRCVGILATTGTSIHLIYQSIKVARGL